MTAMPGRCDDIGRSTQSQLNLQQALRTLRALRQRYEMACNGNSNSRFLSIQVALSYTDMSWITAAIEALEKAIVPAASEDLAKRDPCSAANLNRIGSSHRM